MAFDQLKAAVREEYLSAFHMLALAVPVEAPPTASGDDGVAPPPQVLSKLVVRLDGLVNLLRIMNIAIPDEALLAAVQKLGTAAGGTFDRGFTLNEVREMYDVLAPLQQTNLTPYMQFFNLLDVHETGSVPVADLKHALCTLGDKLDPDEFHHILYKCKLLERDRLTVFEFLRVVLRIGSDGKPM
jgi:Ca2+-binding EF-hand superfamily protein